MSAQQIGRGTNSARSPFQGRNDELGLILGEKERGLLQNFYGVAGIGKSRLLEEAGLRLRQQRPRSVLLRLDLKELPDETSRRSEALLQSLAAQEPTRLRGTWENTGQVAAEIVMKLNDMASDPVGETPVLLLVDTT